jgi:integral membrane protein
MMAATTPAKRSPLVNAYVAFAWATGVAMVLLVFVGMPLKYWAHSDELDKIVGMTHGMGLYPIYVILSIATAFVYRLSIPHMALMALAGLIPGLSPYVAGRTLKHIDAKQAERIPAQTQTQSVDSPISR